MRKAKQQPGPWVESLEPRKLLSKTVPTSITPASINSSNNDENAVTVSVDGKPVSSNETIGFGTNYAGLPGGVKTIKITNIFDQPITVAMDAYGISYYSYTIQPTPYAVTGVLGPTEGSGLTTTTVPVTLAPGAFTKIQVQFNPDADYEVPPGQIGSTMTVHVTVAGSPTGVFDYNVNVGGRLISPNTGLVGSVQFDQQGNGQFNSNDGPIPGIFVYLDQDHSGVYDPVRDPSSTTQDDGSFSFQDIPAGKYIVREVVPANWHQSSPANDDGIYTNTKQSNSGNLIFLQQQNPGSTLSASIVPQTIVSPGTGPKATVVVDVKFAGPDVDTSTFADTNFTVTSQTLDYQPQSSFYSPPEPFKQEAVYIGLASGDPGPGHGYRVAEYDVDFTTSNFDSDQDGSYYFNLQSDQVQDDQLGSFPPQSVIHAFDIDIPNAVSVTYDRSTVSPWGTIDLGKTQAAFPGPTESLTVTNILSETLTFTMDAKATGADGAFATVLEANGQSQTSAITLAPDASTTLEIQFNPGGADSGAGGMNSGVLGIYPNIAGVTGTNDFYFQVSGTLLVAAKNFSIQGNVYDDSAGTPIPAASRPPGIGGVICYLDMNGNGVYDPNVDPISVSYNDVEDDASYGDFQFGSLPVGNYTVREIVPAGWYQSVPAPGQGVSITRSEAQKAASSTEYDINHIYVDFLEQKGQAPAATVSGHVYFDSNVNGTKDAGDAPAADLTVYLDLKNDGTLDAGDPTITTDADGAYSFADLTPGRYQVRVDDPPGDSALLPAANNAQVVYASAPMNYGGNDFLLASATVTPSQQLTAERAALTFAITDRQQQLNQQRQTITEEIAMHQADILALKAAITGAQEANVDGADPSYSEAVTSSSITLAKDQDMLAAMRKTDFTGIAQARRKLAEDQSNPS